MNIRRHQEAAMRSQTPGWLVAIPAMLLIAAGAVGQGTFQNLNFEAANIPNGTQPGLVNASNAIPGWTAYRTSSTFGTSELNLIGYDTIDLGGGGVFLVDGRGGSLSPILGAYSIFLHGSSAAGPYSFSIGQSGQIPITAQSLTFVASAFNYQVTFNGQIVPLSVVGNEASYQIYGADIANYAGQTGELLFTAQGYGPDIGAGGFLLDNIQFSNQAIPEPSVLSTLGAMLVCWRVLRLKITATNRAKEARVNEIRC